MTLTCSSDANPAANYTWYKENEDSPTASGQIFTITHITAEHGGQYQCEAQNTQGRSNTTFHLTVGAGESSEVRTPLKVLELCIDFSSESNILQHSLFIHCVISPGAWKSAVTGTTTALLLVVLLLAVFLWIR